MCSYCINIETGNDYNPIIASEMDFGFFGNVEADVYLASDTTNQRNKKPFMILGLCENDGTGEFERKVRINFCPMCGGEL